MSRLLRPGRSKVDKEYIGDSVYVEVIEGGTLKLTTENGKEDDPSNTIFLEEEVYRNLLDYVKRFNSREG